MRDDRAQTFTLEGFMSAMVVLVAVLFALQSTVLTSTTTGGVGADSQAQLRQEATDILVSSAANGNLSTIVRYWDSDGRRFSGATDCTVGYGADGLPKEMFGGALAQTFGSRGFSYNVVLSFRDHGTAAADSNTSCIRDVSSPRKGQTVENGTREVVVLSQGTPTANAVTARQTVTLYDNQVLTAPGASGRELGAYDIDPNDGDEGFYPIPDAAPGSPLYNVVEVRIVVW